MDHKEIKREKEDKEQKKIQVFFNYRKKRRISAKYSWTKNTESFFKETIKKPH